MAISQTPDIPLRATNVKWSPPEGATFVTCALFACTPQFIDFDRGDGLVVGAIVNREECMLNVVTAKAGESQVNIGALAVAPPCLAASGETLEASGETLGASGETFCAPGYVMVELMVGCWAYDGTRIVGASTLQDVDPLATFLAERQAGDCSRAEHEGRVCRRANESRLGTCSRGACMPRCQAPRDCQFLEPSASAAPAANTTDEGREDGGSDPVDAGPVQDLDGGIVDAAGPDAAPLPSCGFTCEALEGRSDIGVCTRIGAGQP